MAQGLLFKPEELIRHQRGSNCTVKVILRWFHWALIKSQVTAVVLCMCNKPIVTLHSVWSQNIYWWCHCLAAVMLAIIQWILLYSTFVFDTEITVRRSIWFWTNIALWPSASLGMPHRRNAGYGQSKCSADTL